MLSKHFEEQTGGHGRPIRSATSRPAPAPGASSIGSMPNIGPLELAIVLVIALVIFGPKRLPDLGRSLGSGMREFKDSLTGKDDDDDEEEQAKLEAAAAQPQPDARASSPSRARSSPTTAPRPGTDRSAVARLKPAQFDDRMTLVEHLDELRTRIIVSGGRARARGRRSASGRTTPCSRSPTSRCPRDLEPLTFSPTEPFFTTVKLSIYGGILLALPILLYQVYAFVLPAFSPTERRVVFPMLLAVPFLFIAGTVFAYFVVLPPALNFLLGFNDRGVQHPDPRLASTTASSSSP